MLDCLARWIFPNFSVYSAVEGIWVSDLAPFPWVGTWCSVMTLSAALGSDPGGISWTLFITCRVSASCIKHQKWEYFPPVSCGIWQLILHCVAHEDGYHPSKWEKPGRESLRYWYTQTLHYYIRVECKLILNHDPTQVGLSRRLTFSSTLRSTSRVWPQGCTQCHNRTSCANSRNRG